MSTLRKVLIEFPVMADSDGHAVVLIKELLKQKGIVRDGVVAHEFYVFIKPPEWR